MTLAEILANEPQTPATAPTPPVASGPAARRAPGEAGDAGEGARQGADRNAGPQPTGAEPSRADDPDAEARLAEAAARYLDAWERNQAEISLAGPPPGLDLRRG